MAASIGKGIMVTVIIPTYNAEYHLQLLLESLSGQTVYPEQIIVVDDGSDKNKAEINEHLAVNYDAQYSYLPIIASRSPKRPMNCMFP